MDKYEGYKEGSPQVPEGSVKTDSVIRKSRSQSFREFLESEKISLKNWRYHMEKWITPSGKIVKKHYWRQMKTGRMFYHLRQL